MPAKAGIRQKRKNRNHKEHKGHEDIQPCNVILSECEGFF